MRGNLCMSFLNGLGTNEFCGTRKKNIIEFSFFLSIFMGLFIFFRFVYPLVPQCADDWNMLVGFMEQYPYAFPTSGWGYFTPFLLNTLCGYIAAFLIFPITGNYISALITITALVRSVSIVISLIMIYRILLYLSSNTINAILCTLFFLTTSFLMFKTKSASEYLYWQYNFCTVYLYGIPNYLASAFSVFLIYRHITPSKKSSNLNTGFLLIMIYLLAFSMLSTGFLVASVSGWIIVLNILQEKNVKIIFIKCWTHFLSIVLFFICLFFEMQRTFGTGYFVPISDLRKQIGTSGTYFFSIFKQMNKLFWIPSLIIILAAFYVFLKNSEYDKTLINLLVILVGTAIFTGIFVILLGAMDFWHISALGTIRIDISYIFYFPILLLITLSLSYLIYKLKKFYSVSLLLVMFMLYTVFSPYNKYSSSLQDDLSHNPNFYINVMQRVVQEVCERDKEGITYTVAHIPYIGSGGEACAYVLYRHHITDHLCTIEFRYEPEVKAVYFD